MEVIMEYIPKNSSVAEGLMHPIKNWCGSAERGAIVQAEHLANLPFIFKHVSLMPDTHEGYGMPIGGVIACNHVVIPNAVGVDIGCGMRAYRTALTEITIDNIKAVMGKIREVIPTGFDHNKEACSDDLMPFMEVTPLGCSDYYPVISGQYQKAKKQLGTLGGGNHFIEIQKGSDGHIWIMIHSGSRNLGKQVADHYNKLAKELNEKWFSSVPKEWDLAFLPIETEEAKSYWREMNYCLEFAKANRQLMMTRIKECFDKVMPFWQYAGEEDLDIHHNYAVWENHFNNNVIVHRKGATRAREGELGIIPGSQGTASYIVKGLGNKDSFMSCSHGAGRKMGRGQAQRTLNLADEIKRMEDKGIVHGIRNQADLDEAAGAYKDIDVVMDEQKDLVEIVTKLEPMAVIKA